ncbi:MAG: hypothetical protein AAF806_13715 [Bacteroidota bacterium]
MNNYYCLLCSLLLFTQACSPTDVTSDEESNDTNSMNITYTINAIEDVNSLSITGFPSAYIDKNRKAIALNAGKHKGVYTAADYIFEGTSHIYSLTLHTLCELDGESRYRVAINGQLLDGIKTNPIIFGSEQPDYTPASHTWEKVELSKGDTIRVEASSETNGKIPEGEITAYSRGRFTSLVLQPIE